MQQKKAGRKKYTAEVTKTCGRCKMEIPAGQPYWQDMSKTSVHPDCVRLKVTSMHQERSRFLQDNPTGRPCEGCGDTIRAGERAVHVMTLPWHHECRVRDVRLRM